MKNLIKRIHFAIYILLAVVVFGCNNKPKNNPKIDRSKLYREASYYSIEASWCYKQATIAVFERNKHKKDSLVLKAIEYSKKADSLTNVANNYR